MTQAGDMDVWVMLGSVVLIWSMPALMTFSEVAVVGGCIWAMFAAVLFANLRNIPMIVTSLPLIRTERRPGWQDFLFAQLLSPTTWLHSLMDSDRIPLKSRRSYFTAFSLTVFASALVGATVGYFGVEYLPAELRPPLLILTPLYLLLIILSVRRLSGYLSLVFGAAALPYLMAWSVEWGLALGGLGAGTLGFLIGGGLRRKASS